MIKRILVPTDFSDAATNAVRYASALAKRIGARLTLTYADTFLPPIDYISECAVWAETAAPVLEATAKRRLADTISKCVDPSVSADYQVAIATPAKGILQQSQNIRADLIVMGTHGRSGLSRAILGSVTESVMRKSLVAVMAIPPNTSPAASVKTIVCPVETNARGAELLRLASSLAPETSEFVIVGVNDDITAIQRWVPPELQRRSKAMVVTANDAAAKISQLALGLNADLIVATEPAARDVAQRVLGTFAERLLRYHTCPILTMSERVPLHKAQEISTAVEMALD